MKKLEKDRKYRAFLFNPTNGEELAIGEAKGDENGEWRVPGPTPIFQDWVLVLERVK